MSFATNQHEATSVKEEYPPPPVVPNVLSSQELPELTTVNGIGMWNQWTRNFKTPLLALLDLMDNAFDAACVERDFPGRLHVYTDLTENDLVSGLVLKNNSPRHIKPMAQVLQVYQSCKGNLSESIGENGVGLKQGCATLSDLSFCLSKNLRHYSLGILSKRLQRDDGCSLPSFTFPTSPTFRELQELFHSQPLVGECIEQYGNGSVTRGTTRLLRHLQEMEDSHVFLVILHHLRHGSHCSAANTVDYTQSALGLLSKLKEELPRQYIHVPSTVGVRLQDECIAFAYWQQRLIELSSFRVKIDPNHAVMDAQDWIDPAQGYKLRIYAGFDPMRVEKSTKSPVSLFVYSRQSGRLIKHSSDARSVLMLSSGGTQYCQGLTILVDDVHGKLPLNPTKQDLAFGEETNGEIHHSNLYTWLSAVTRLYYDFHLSKFEKKQKGLLTEQVKRHVNWFQNMDFIKPLPECRLTKFGNVEWLRKGGRIYARKGYQHNQGADTLVQLKAPNKTPAPKNPPTLKNPPTQLTTAPTQQGVARSSAFVTLPVIEIGNLRKRKADDTTTSHDEQPNTSRHYFQADIIKLERDNSKLHECKNQLRDELRIMQDQKNELQRQNASLKKALSQERSRSVCETQEFKNALKHEQLQELALVKLEVEGLKQALAASQESVEVARNETEIQEEIANGLRKKWAELKRRVQTNS